MKIGKGQLMSEFPSGKVLIGHKLKRLRASLKLSQADMASELGISSSYLNLLENNVRPVTVPVLFRLGQTYDVDLREIAEDDSARLIALLTEVFADPVLSGQSLTRRDIQQLASQHPTAAEALIHLHRSFDDMRNAAHHGGELQAESRTAAPVEQVRAFQERAENYFDEIEDAARDCRGQVDTAPGSLSFALIQMLTQRYGIETKIMPAAVMGGLLREFDPHRGRLLLSESLREPQRLFQTAVQIGLSGYRQQIDEVVARSGITDVESQTLLRTILASYFAGAVMMPYADFHHSAQSCRYDLEGLAARYTASFEQVCHRLTTMNRPSDRGIPFFFLRVDEAGYISKRLSGGGMEFARYGGACGRWVPHQAFRTPGMIVAQASVLEEGQKLLTIACTHQAPRTQPSHFGTPLYTIALGCDLKYAPQICHADILGSSRTPALTPIGLGCQVCEREGCQHRGSPPRGHRAQYDLSRRHSGLFSGVR